MQLARPVVARAPGAFGRGQVRQLCPPQAVETGWSIGSDLKLFATTFLAGFLFVSILIG